MPGREREIEIKKPQKEGQHILAATIIFNYALYRTLLQTVSMLDLQKALDIKLAGLFI